MYKLKQAASLVILNLPSVIRSRSTWWESEALECCVNTLPAYVQGTMFGTVAAD